MQAKSPRYVAYLRVSTERQGRSGLGLDAQRQAIADFFGGQQPVAEFVEVESGKRNERPQLAKALHRAKVTGAILIIAKLDRLSRNASFITALQESRVRFVACDMPEANDLIVGVMAMIAQHERKAISERTKAALAAAKRRGQKLGNPNGARALRGRSGHAEAAKVIGARVARFDADLAPIIADIRAGGITSYRGIAGELNARGIISARGGAWYPATVRAVIVRC